MRLPRRSSPCALAIGRLSIVSGLCMLAPSARAAVSVVDLGVLPGDSDSQAIGISRDGSTVVGASGTHVFRWTAAGGMQNLGLLPGTIAGAARAANTDGSVIVGNCDGPNGRRGFRWTPSGGMQDIGTVPNIQGGITVFGVSANGNTIVGEAGATTAAFRWTSSAGMQAIYPGNPANAMSNGGRAVSADGSVLVGITLGGGSYRWTAPNNSTFFQTFNNPPPYTGGGVFVSGVSGDGQTAFGQTYVNSQGFQATLWNAAGAIEGLGQFNGRPTNAIASSFDGSVIVGSVFGGNAFLWTRTFGMQDLSTYLTGQGVDTTGWVLSYASAISDDGRTIAGQGVHDGQYHAFVVNIPAPSTALASAGLILWSTHRRRR